MEDDNNDNNDNTAATTALSVVTPIKNTSLVKGRLVESKSVGKRQGRMTRNKNQNTKRSSRQGQFSGGTDEQAMPDPLPILKQQDVLGDCHGTRAHGQPWQALALCALPGPSMQSKVVVVGLS
jgi:hypothetical protein